MTGDEQERVDLFPVVESASWWVIGSELGRAEGR